MFLWSLVQLMAGFSAVAATALHAIALAGAWPQPPVSRNKAVLVHSAAGGVGYVFTFVGI
jgi:NADPH:quinone reductase-like Zn-dependent oxidoreductase